MTAPKRRQMAVDLEFVVEPGAEPGAIIVMVMLDGQPFSFLCMDRDGGISDFAPCPPLWTPPGG